MLIFLTIMLFIVAIFLIMVPKYKKEKIEKHKLLKVLFEERVVEFIINICVTIIGVTLAILLTNYDANRQNIDKTISLLSSLDRELKMVEDNISVIYIPAYQQLKEQDREQEFLNFYSVSPISSLYTLESIIGNEIVVTNTNYYSYAALIDSQHAIAISYDRLENINDAESLVVELQFLNDSCSFMRKVIQKEIDFQSGRIPENEMEKVINEIYEELYLREE